DDATPPETVHEVAPGATERGAEGDRGHRALEEGAELHEDAQRGGRGDPERGQPDAAPDRARLGRSIEDDTQRHHAEGDGATVTEPREGQGLNGLIEQKQQGRREQEYACWHRSPRNGDGGHYGGAPRVVKAARRRPRVSSSSGAPCRRGSPSARPEAMPRKSSCSSTPMRAFRAIPST